MTPGGLEVHPLTADRWADVVELFGPSGAFSNCWCTWWRQTGGEFERGIRQRGGGNRAFLASLTDAGREPGLMAYRDGRPVEWISVAPRPDYGRVIRSPSIGPGRRSPEAADESVWSVVDTGGERHPQSNVFTGTLAMFRRVGFTEVDRRAEGRPIVRRFLT